MTHLALLVPGLDRLAGAERQVILLAKGLAGQGWRVSVVALSGSGGDAAGDLKSASVDFLSLQMRKGLADPRGWLRLHRWLQSQKPDVVHAHLSHAAWLARWSRLAAPVRVVVDTLHSSSTGTLGRKLGYRLGNWLPDRVSAVSQAAAQTHLASRMVSAGKLVVIPNGVDVDAWRPDAPARQALRKELGIGDEFLWLAAGRMDAVKDYPTLLQAISGAPEPARLVIAGTGPLESEMRRLSTELGLDHRVRFLGFEQDVRRWMQAADGLVLSSRWEGLPMALLEAAACALPAVATSVPGTSEVIVDGETGFLAAPGSSVALQGAITRLMRTPMEERKAMGERARQLAVERFSLDVVLDRWEELYLNLLRSRPAPRRWGRSQTEN